MKTDCKLSSGLVLQLNGCWQHTAARTVRQAISGMVGVRNGQPFLGVDVHLNPDGTLGSDTRALTLAEWKTLPIRECDDAVGTVRGPMRVPRVIITPGFTRMPRVEIRLSKRGVYERDHGRCQYCSEGVSFAAATLDHVVPRTLFRQGKAGAAASPTTWENVVLACEACNRRKADRPLATCGLRLLRAPVRPGRRYRAVHAPSAALLLPEMLPFLAAA